MVGRQCSKDSAALLQTQKGDLKLIMENDLTKIMEFQLSCSSLCVFLGCSSEPDEGDAKHEVHRLEI